jgi:hypothetical protein
VDKGTDENEGNKNQVTVGCKSRNSDQDMSIFKGIKRCTPVTTRTGQFPGKETVDYRKIGTLQERSCVFEGDIFFTIKTQPLCLACILPRRN